MSEDSGGIGNRKPSHSVGDPATIEETLQTALPVQQAKDHKKNIFPFLKLPAELRNKIYEHLLTSCYRLGRSVNSDYADYINGVIIGNVLLARRKMRLEGDDADVRRILAAHNLPWPQKRGINIRCTKPLWSGPALLETAILHLCRQTYNEGIGVLYSTNTFAVITRAMEPHGNPFCAYLPSGIDLSRIQRFRLEVQLGGTLGEPKLQLVEGVLSAFRAMSDLRSIQVIITFRHGFKEFLYQQQGQALIPLSRPSNYRRELKMIAQAIPSHVQVTWGMTKEKLKWGDFGGFYPADGSGLQTIINE